MKQGILLVLLSCLYVASMAQQRDSLLPATDVGFLNMNDTITVNKGDLATQAPTITKKPWNSFENKYFTLNIGAAILLDHNILVQDDNNIQQVGKVDPGTEFRGDRFIFSGNLLFFKGRPWRYMVSINYNGLDAPEGKKSLDFVDWNFEIPFGHKGGWLTVGKQKEGVGHEYVAPGTQGMFMERGSGAPMFIRQRNIGIRYSNSILDKRMTYTLGVFNNYWETDNSFSDNGSQFTTRVTGLPHYTSDRDLMHVAVGFRSTQAIKDQLTYKAKPEANTAPSFINTGAFEADGASTLMLEWIGVKGPVAIVTEYMHAFVNSDITGDPNFNYFQIGGGWVITGENRRYNKTTGNLSKLVPNKNFRFKNGTGPGAFEVAARYTYSRGSDALIEGGKFGRFTTALSWFANAHVRLEVNYGRGRLDRKDLIGKTDFWQFRLQFEL